jgi:hypothetical protein
VKYAENAQKHPMDMDLIERCAGSAGTAIEIDIVQNKGRGLQSEILSSLKINATCAVLYP